MIIHWSITWRKSSIERKLVFEPGPQNEGSAVAFSSSSSSSSLVLGSKVCCNAKQWRWRHSLLGYQLNAVTRNGAKAGIGVKGCGQHCGKHFFPSSSYSLFSSCFCFCFYAAGAAKRCYGAGARTAPSTRCSNFSRAHSAKKVQETCRGSPSRWKPRRRNRGNS